MPNYMNPSFDNHVLFDIVIDRVFVFFATVPSIEGFTACQYVGSRGLWATLYALWIKTASIPTWKAISADMSSHVTHKSDEEEIEQY